MAAELQERRQVKRYLAEADAQAEGEAEDEDDVLPESAVDSDSEATAKKGKRKLKAELPVKYASQSSGSMPSSQPDLPGS